VVVAIGVDVWATLTIQGIEAYLQSGRGGLGTGLLLGLWVLVEIVFNLLVGLVGLIIAGLARQWSWLLGQIVGIAPPMLFFYIGNLW
jgi:hypothetical protein